MSFEKVYRVTIGELGSYKVNAIDKFLAESRACWQYIKDYPNAGYLVPAGVRARHKIRIVRI